MNKHHKKVLEVIISLSGDESATEFSDAYVGTSHPRFAINAPTLRQIAKEWAKENKEMSMEDFAVMLTSMIEGKSATEKIMAGILMDAASKKQRQFSPGYFKNWLNHVEGWAEVDALCTGTFMVTEVHRAWPEWKKLILTFAKDKNIHKRRASLAILCSPIRKSKNADMAATAFIIIQTLKGEKHILITKAISWLLRSMTGLYKDEVAAFVDAHEHSLPKVAIRETRIKLLTGKKTAR